MVALLSDATILDHADQVRAHARREPVRDQHDRDPVRLPYPPKHFLNGAFGLTVEVGGRLVQQ